MKTQEKQATITDLCNLIAHETVSFLEAFDDDGILTAQEMRDGLTLLAAVAGAEDDIEMHLAWIDREIANLQQTTGTPHCVTHLIPTPQLVRTIDIDAQIDSTIAFFRIAAQANQKETRTKLLDLARTITDICGMGDCLYESGDVAVEKMKQIWDAFSEAATAEEPEIRQALLENATTMASELHNMTTPQTDLEDGRVFMSMDELRAELDDVAQVIAPQSDEPQFG